ncbi:MULTISPECIES: hypothetical protein [Pseudomonas]|uniref:Prophage PssSM-02, Orf71 n=2 Tax=Pseudomonas syringae group TaxID=136849 RepID=A0A0P9MXA3_9PSED|nr:MULTISPECIES: hypothetical protein [Pseudomonas]AVX22833.1 hypothetical protein DA456_05200 [Pseudomonas syringae pv. atrofaciens]KPW10614.1 Prophage PssSM-02, Orf71 [Pseudomonas syringae pv. atrofaciens]KPW96881.1 Prophage PssSM-02, Orf71 [Pseudomonas syringae pv. coryli]KZL39579.1 prophage PssSM-02 [Pseudomonas syringae pv. syringae]MBP1086007.1 hypothetical protein [Pseudomonas sp. PvP007]
MPFIAVNSSNGFDMANNTRYATEAEADSRAREILNQFPTAQVFTAQLLKDYSAKVTVTAKASADPVSEASADTASA